MAQGDEYNALAALADYDDDCDDAATEDDDDAPTSPTSAAPVALPRLLITNGPEQAAAPAATAPLKTNQAVWLPLVVPGPDGNLFEVRVKGILGRIYKGGDPDSTECTVVIKGVNYNSLEKRGKSRTSTPRRAPRAPPQPESSALAAAARERNEVPLEDQRPPKKQKPTETEPSTRAVVRILVVEREETVPQLLGNLKPLARADLFVAAAPGAMERQNPALPHGSFLEVLFATRTVKKQTKVDLRAIVALVARIKDVAQKDLLAAIAFDCDTVSDEDLLFWPNLAFLDTETVATHGTPPQLQALVESPEYVKLAGPSERPLQKPAPPEVVEISDDDE